MVPARVALHSCRLLQMLLATRNGCCGAREVRRRGILRHKAQSRPAERSRAAFADRPAAISMPPPPCFSTPAFDMCASQVQHGNAPAVSQAFGTLRSKRGRRDNTTASRTFHQLRNWITARTQTRKRTPALTRSEIRKNKAAGKLTSGLAATHASSCTAERR